MLKLAGVPVAPVTWHKDGHPPQGAEIVFASAHTMGMGVIDAAMTAKNVRRQAELARTERIIRQRRDISA